MNYSAEIQAELDWINNGQFQRGQYIYMGMGKLNGKTVCISVAYKIDYCIKKARQFVDQAPGIFFDHINKVKVGELVACSRFSMQ